MASSYNGNLAVKAVIQDRLLSQTVLTGLIKETKGNSSLIDNQVMDDQSVAINAGTDVAFYSAGGEIDLSGLAKNVVKSLNALIFSTTEEVNLTLPKQFKGAVVLGGGDDTLNAGDSTKGLDISSGAGNDTITTGSGQDTVKGGDGDDVIDTGKGDDQISGGTGDDSISAGAGNDTIYAGQGDDSIDAGAGKDLIAIRNNDGATEVDGGAGKDTLDLSAAGQIVEIHEHEPGVVMFHFDNGSSVTVTNVESFKGDFDGDGAVDNVGLVGLSDFFS